MVLTLLTLRTWFQIGYWKDDVSLFSHCIKINPDNYVAHTDLGDIYAFQDKSEEAFHHFHEALRIHPNDVFALDGIAHLYSKMDNMINRFNFIKRKYGIIQKMLTYILTRILILELYMLQKEISKRLSNNFLMCLV